MNKRILRRVLVISLLSLAGFFCTRHDGQSTNRTSAGTRFEARSQNLCSLC